MNDSKKFSSSRLGRLGKLGKSLAVATGHLALDVVKNKTQEIIDKNPKAQEITRRALAAKEIVQSMGELKGAMMKIGQMISITEDLVLPPEISALFKELQKSAPPMPRADLESVFMTCFQKSPEQIFQEFNYTPMAAASIGQVHYAKTHEGEEVAVKIQYPKIVEAIQNDFKNLDRINQLITLLVPGKPNIENYVQELRRSLLEECDYLKEIEHIDKFRELYSSQCPNLIVPKVYKELSNRSILTMELMQGDSFEETQNYSQEEKDQLGQILFDAHIYGIYGARYLHTDPQNGNYLFKKGKIILLDFGSIRSFDEEFIQLYVELLKSIEDNQLEEYRRIMLALGFFEPTDNQVLFENHFEMIKKLYLPYTQPGMRSIIKLNPFELIQDFMKGVSIKGRKAPREEFLLLDRANLGLYSKLKSWGSVIDWTNLRNKCWEPYLINIKNSSRNF